jgi:peptide/nickel transport system substrate-binding protein
MAHRPRWLSLAAVGLIAAFLVVACQPAAPASPTPTATAPAATQTPTGTATEAPATGTPGASPTEAPTAEPGATPYPDPIVTPSEVGDLSSYPNYGQEVDCENGTFNGLPYEGSVKQITAPDASTVVFELCGPDVAFLQKVAFIVFAINDSDYLQEAAPSGEIVGTMNGTGPYRLDEWRRGAELVFSAFEDYWGEAAANASGVLRWASESAQRLTELQAGQVHGITNVGPADFDIVRNDPNLELALPPEGEVMNTLYIGMNHNFAPWDNPLVRQAMAVGIDRQRIVDNFYPEGSEVASHFTPCALEFGCEGEAWPDYNPEQARTLLTEAGFPDGFETVINYRNVFRGYLPLPPDVAEDLRAQLAEIGITATVEEQESGTFIGNANNGQLRGLFLLGWGADYPEVTNFLDFHFGTGATSAFGDPYPEITAPLSRGNSTADDAERQAAYEEANNAILEQVPMVPVAHGAFALAYQAGVGNPQVSSLSDEYLWAMTPPSGDQIVFMQNAEPIGVYCADETDGESLRACLQTMEGLYGIEVNGVEAVPKLAESCDPNEDASVWTCTLRSGVTFHNGATFEAQDVVLSYAVQWDALHPLHVGNTGAFEYWPGLWGGSLNPPAPCGLPNSDPCPAE